MNATTTKRTRSYITAEASVDVEIDEFDDDVVIQRAREILAERAKSGVAMDSDGIDLGVSPTWLAECALQAYNNHDQQKFDHLSKELVSEITGRIL